jgi:ribonuclease HII
MTERSYLVAGIDEAGCGSLVGSVLAAAVILNHSNPIHGLDDSKKLSEKKRLVLFNKIKDQSLAWSIGSASTREIDSLNILRSTMLAMQRAITSLHKTPHLALVDGRYCPPLPMPSQAIVHGDSLVPEISAASIMAKVVRDNYMSSLNILLPHYGLDQNKGYPTRFHMRMLRKHGVTPHHRHSFKPVRSLL